MKKCNNCGREFNDYQYYRCCPQCLRFVDEKENKSLTAWKIVGGVSAFLLFVCAIYFIWLAENRGIDGWLFGMPFIILSPLCILSKIKKDEKQNARIETKIIELLISKDVDVESTWISSNLRRIINEEISKR